MAQIPVKKYRHSLSEREAAVVTELCSNHKSVFNLEDIKKLVDSPKNILDQLRRKNWILKLKNGVYAIAPLEAGIKGAHNNPLTRFIIGSALVKPYYIGYWSALNHYGFTEQIPTYTFVATTKPRKNITIQYSQIKFVTIPPHKMFGIREIMIQNRAINISTPEKTFIDCLDHPEHAYGIDEVARALYFSADELDLKLLAKMAIKIRNGTVVKRLGYISELLGYEKCLDVLENVELKKGYSYLDTLGLKKGKIKEKWSLVINAKLDPKIWEQ